MDFVLVTPPNSRLREVTSSSPKTVDRIAAARPSAVKALPERPSALTLSSQDIFRSRASSAPRGLAGVDRRWAQRAKVEKQGWIGIASREEPVACVVCNVSKFGAMLELPSTDAIGAHRDRQTDTFVLVWLTNRVRSEATCTVRWRSGRLIGVNFAGPVRTMVDRR